MTATGIRTLITKLLTATRIPRTVPTLLVMLVSCAYAGYLPLSVIFLGIGCVLVYASAGIHNAIRDHDYILPRQSGFFVIGLISLALLISSAHAVIFLTILAWILGGLFYNTIARRILFGDSTVLAITHFALPSFASSLLVGLPLSFAATLSSLFFLIGWFITPTKNIKDTETDKKRGYVTLTTAFSSGRKLTHLFMGVALLLMVLSSILLSRYLTAVIIGMSSFIILRIAKKETRQGNDTYALGLLRLIVIVFLLSLIIETTLSTVIALGALFLAFGYVLYLAFFRQGVGFLVKQEELS